MSPLKVGTVGVGALGRHHARILSQMQDVELVAVADSNEAQGRRVAESCGCRWTADYRDLFESVDAVSIAVPTSAHFSIASPFLHREIPVLVEKPLADDLHQAESLVQLAERRQTLLQVGHVERFNPAMQVAAAHCGTPKYIRAERVSPYAFRSTDIGVVHDLMIHDIDLILHLVGDSQVRRTEAFGICLMGGHEDSVQARLHFDSGCIADLTAHRVNPNGSRTMQIWTDTGCVTVDFTTRRVVRYTPTETLQFGTSPCERAEQPGADVEQLKQQVFGKFIEVSTPTVPEDDALTSELRSFVDCVRNATPPHVGGREALRALQVADAVLQSLNAHQWDATANGRIGPMIFRPGQRIAHRDAG